MNSAREHLNWCVERALDYYDRGDQMNAIASFMSNVSKDPRTEWIQTHPITLSLLFAEARVSREAFQKAMNGFNV